MADSAVAGGLGVQVPSACVAAELGWPCIGVFTTPPASSMEVPPNLSGSASLASSVANERQPLLSSPQDWLHSISDILG